MTPKESQESEYSFPYHYVAQFREHFTQTFVDSWGINYVSTIEFILGKLTSFQWHSVIDIGCGDGRLTREIALDFPDRSVRGIDYSDRAIALAKAMNRDCPQISFQAIDITSRNDHEPADVALLIEVLEHIPPALAPAFLRGIRNRLKTGGTLLLTVPHCNKAVEYKHYRHFDIAALTTLLSPEFDVTELVPFERIAISRRLIDALLSNRLFALTNQKLLKAVYRYYRNNLFDCRDESECQRIFVRAVAKPTISTQS